MHIHLKYSNTEDIKLIIFASWFTITSHLDKLQVSFEGSFMGRQSEKNDLNKNACKFVHLREQTCRHKLYRYKLTVKYAIYCSKIFNCLLYTLSNFCKL